MFTHVQSDLIFVKLFLDSGFSFSPIIASVVPFQVFGIFAGFFKVFVSPTFASVVFFQVWIRRLQHSNAVKHNVLHRLILRNVPMVILKLQKNHSY